MLFIFLSLCFFILIFTGLGRTTLNLVNYEAPRNPFISLFLGLFITSIVSMAISLFMPVTSIYFIIIIIAGIHGLSIVKKDLKTYIPSPKREHYFFIILFVLMLLTISLFFGYDSYPYNSDTDTYHANSVEWLKQFGTVIGLANLSNRFGVNTAWHTIAATIDHGIWNARSTFILPALGYSSASAYFFWEICYGKSLWQKLYGIAITCWIFCNILTWGFPSLHYDFIALVTNSILVFEVLYLSIHDKNKIGEVRTLLPLLLLSTFSFILKPMGALSILFTAAFCIHLLYLNRKFSIRNLVILFCIPAISFTIWLTRNIYLSGWPFYPSPILPLTFDWTVPRSTTLGIYNDVVAWAKMPGPNYLEVIGKPFSYWFIPWIKATMTTIRFWFIGTIPFVLGIVCWASIGRTIFKKENLFFFTWSVANLLFWFLTAPDIRFGDGFFFVFLTTGITFVTLRFNFINFPAKFFKPLTITMLLIMSLFILAIGATLFSGKRGPVNLLTIGQHGPGPIVKRKIQTNNGTSFFVWTPVPVSSCRNSKLPSICLDNMVIYKELSACGNSPLPCTPFFNKNLKQRNPRKLGDGFTLR